MAKQLTDPSRPNAIDPVTRAEMAVLGTYPSEHWDTLWLNLVVAAQRDYALASTLMAHLSHAEIRSMLAYLCGHDAEALRVTEDGAR